MEVTVLDTGDLPENTVISFHTGAVRRTAPLAPGKAVELPFASTAAPVRVDLMTELASQSVEVVPEKKIYQVHLGTLPQDDEEGGWQQTRGLLEDVYDSGPPSGLARETSSTGRYRGGGGEQAGEVWQRQASSSSAASRHGSKQIERVPEERHTVVTFRIRERDQCGNAVTPALLDHDARGGEEGFKAESSDVVSKDAQEPKDGYSAGSRRLQTARMMRSYLDNHDILRRMQGLMKEIICDKPLDPDLYIINKLQEMIDGSDEWQERRPAQKRRVGFGPPAAEDSQNQTQQRQAAPADVPVEATIAVPEVVVQQTQPASPRKKAEPVPPVALATVQEEASESEGQQQRQGEKQEHLSQPEDAPAAAAAASAGPSKYDWIDKATLQDVLQEIRESDMANHSEHPKFVQHLGRQAAP